METPLNEETPAAAGASESGRYWARTSDLLLVESDQEDVEIGDSAGNSPDLRTEADGQIRFDFGE